MTTAETATFHPNGNVGDRPDAIVIHPDRVEHYRGPLYLQNMQKLLDGYIEAIDARFADLPPATGWLNEEGKMKGLPANPAATAILVESGGIPGDVVAGPMVLTGVPDAFGETQPVPMAWVEEFPETSS